MKTQKSSTFWYIVSMVLGEFFLILDAGFVGYSMEHGISNTLDKYIFWILLALGISLRYIAEKIKPNNIDIPSYKSQKEEIKAEDTKPKSNSLLGKSLLQAGAGLFIFGILLGLLLLMVYLLEGFGISFPIYREDLNLVLTIIATIGTGIYIYNSERAEREKDERKKQSDLLKILFQELTFLENNLESYKNTFSKERRYPFYELWNIDTSLYFKGLSHEIENKETLVLKKNLMTINDKIIIINNMKSESRKVEEDGEGLELVESKGKSLREGIINIINKELLPIIKASKDFIVSFKLP